MMYVMLDFERDKENRLVDDTLHPRFGKDVKTYQLIIFCSPGLLGLLK